MLNVIIFLSELFILFLLSRSLTNLLFTFFYRTTKSKKISVYLMSIIFLPGTVIHELAHALMAVLLRVHVGKMEFIPKLMDNNLKLGSVEIGKTDPIRRILIGMAPFIFGTSILLGIFFFAVSYNLFANLLFVIVIGYCVFEIGNTMFSSKKDMEGALEVIAALIFITLVLYFIGLRIPQINPDTIFAKVLLQQTFQKADLYLVAPVGIDIALIAIFRILRF